MWTFALVATVLLAVAAARAGFPLDVTAALGSAKELYVATERKDGTLSSVKPVWFMYDGDAIYFTTAPGTWKAKRIAAGKPLHIWVGAADGPKLVTRAELSEDPALAAKMAPVYAKKYWIAWMGLFKPNPERVRAGKTLIVKVPAPT